MSHSLALSPGGRLFVQPDEQAEPKLSQAAAARLTEGFAAAPAVDVPAAPPTPPSASASAPKRGVKRKQKPHRGLSAANRARIATAAKVRWAKLRKQRDGSTR
jgi:hypothetical protein